MGVSNTWVSPTHKYFCMTIPKVACSKIKIVLQQLEGLPLPSHTLRIHYRDTPGMSFVPSISDFSTQDAVKILTSPKWFRFCFVRNPYSRLFSAHKQVVMDLTNAYVGFRESIRKSAGYPTPPDSTPKMVGFGDFVRYIGEQSDKDRECPGHNRTGQDGLPPHPSPHAFGCGTHQYRHLESDIRGIANLREDSMGLMRTR